MSPTTPSYHMPAEWSPHLRCLLIHPHNKSTFRLDCLPARKAFLDVARAIATFEPVTIFCQNESLARSLRRDIDIAAETTTTTRTVHPVTAVVVAESDDSWCRDTGPTFLVTRGDDDDDATPDEDDDDASRRRRRRRLGARDWGFNAYGGPREGCYWPCERDARLASYITRWVAATEPKLTVDHFPHHDFILEGGSIHVDGEGTILTTAECLLHPNRNPHLSREDIESLLRRYLGGSKVIWLPRGLHADEDTNGHIDNICCFVSPARVVLAWTDDESDPQYEISREAAAVLERERDAKGRRIRVTKLYNPPPLYYRSDEVESLETTTTTTKDEVDRDEEGGGSMAVERTDGGRLAASYVNFYIANGGVVVPGFGCEESDERAVRTLEDCFPGRTVVQVPSREILLGGGNIHCITQQVPVPTGF